MAPDFGTNSCDYLGLCRVSLRTEVEHLAASFTLRSRQPRGTIEFREDANAFCTKKIIELNAAIDAGLPRAGMRPTIWLSLEVMPWNDLDGAGVALRVPP